MVWIPSFQAWQTGDVSGTFVNNSPAHISGDVVSAPPTSTTTMNMRGRFLGTADAYKCPW
jgi:hypothetical protein